HDLGMEPLRIVNRSPERAGRLALRLGAEAVAFEHLAEALATADLVVSSTGATGTVIGPRVLAEAGRSGPNGDGRPLFLVDLAVPRDVDQAAGSLPGVTLVDLDDLKEALAADGDRGHSAAVESVR